MAENKRGALSDEEVKFIKLNLVKSDEWIGEQLSRRPKTIQKARIEIVAKQRAAESISKNQEDSMSVKYQLHSRPYWQDLKKQYTTEELGLVEYHWSKLVSQFQGDVTHSEELQILKLIALEILMDRCMKERAADLEQLSIYEQWYMEEDKKPAHEQNRDKMAIWDQRRSELKAAQGSKTKDYTILLEKHAKLMSDLKSTRDQRYKDIENNQISILAYLKSMDQEDFRRQASSKTEIFRVAAEKERLRLYQIHKYADDTFDKPILNSESVE